MPCLREICGLIPWVAWPRTRRATSRAVRHRAVWSPTRCDDIRRARLGRRRRLARRSRSPPRPARLVGVAARLTGLARAGSSATPAGARPHVRHRVRARATATRTAARATRVRRGSHAHARPTRRGNITTALIPSATTRAQLASARGGRVRVIHRWRCPVGRREVPSHPGRPPGSVVLPPYLSGYR